MKASRAIFVLEPDEVQAEALRRYAERYAEAANWLIEEVMESHVTDQVQLHRLYYRRLREDYGLPAQSAVLCLKHVAFRIRQPGPTLPVSPTGPLPYDRHLHSLRSVDRLSLATLDGRVVLPCAFTGYIRAIPTVARGQLAFEEGDWIFAMRAELPDQALKHARARKEAPMSDKLLSRISRLVSGVAHNALSQAELAAPVPVMEQAVREIEEATAEVRTEIGKAEATKFNLERRIADLDAEHEELQSKVDIAIVDGKEALAEAGVARQLDIENQVALLKRAVADAVEEAAKLADSMNALQASRREAQDRLRDLRKAGNGGPGGGTPAAKRSAAAKAGAAIEKAQRLGDDLTGVPGETGEISSKDLEDLADLHRKHKIRERLAEQKARLKKSS